MPYKDPNLQREAVRKAVEKHRVLQTGITKEGITGIRDVIPDMVFQDDGSILKWDAVERNKDKLTQLITFMVGDEKAKKYLKDIRFGVFGPTLDRVGVALGVL